MARVPICAQGSYKPRSHCDLRGNPNGEMCSLLSGDIIGDAGMLSGAVLPRCRAHWQGIIEEAMDGTALHDWTGFWQGEFFLAADWIWHRDGE